MILRKRLMLTTLAAACGFSSVASGQDKLLPGQLGTPFCFPTVPAQSAPGLVGTPQWPAPGQTPSDQVRGDIGDPRWGAAPLTALTFDNNPSESEFMRYRMLINEAHTELTVSLQMQDDPNGSDARDSVFFGIANSGGQEAFGIKIPVYSRGANNTPVFGQYVAPDETLVEHYHYVDDMNPSTDKSSHWVEVGVEGTPSWVSNIALWNDPAAQGTNGAAWVVQFKVRLRDIGLAEDAAPRVTLGANVVEGSGAFSPAIPYAIPNTISGCGTTVSCKMTGPFFFDPAQWTPASTLNGGCADGIVIDKLDLGTGLTQNQDTGPLWIDPRPGQANTFKVRPKYNNVPVFDGTLNARIRVSNWGTIADPQTGWSALLGKGVVDGKRVTSGETRNVGDNPTEISYSCTNASDENNTCELRLNTALHQCMHVELSAVDANRIPFTQATAWRNTRFVKASTVNETAEISVRGLQRILGNTNARDVYLHVVTTNMPVAGNVPMQLNVPALEALRDQVDPFFEPAYSSYCADSNDLCLPTGDGFGQCARPWYSGCDGSVISLPDANYLCLSNESCTVPAGGGANSWLTSMTRSQQLTANYPTIMVYPYYDSGETYAVDGVQRKRLVPMYSFGLHVKHEGQFYGWLHELVGTGLEEIRPDWYKITIPNEGTQQIRVMLSAEEQPHYAPFSKITGSAATLGANFGAVSLSGVTPSQPVDLRQATIRMDRVLQDNGKELVSGVGAGITLRPAPGALASAATFVSTTSSPKIVMEVIDVPFVGLVSSVQVGNTSVGRPSSCGWFGTAMLTTSFTIDDGSHAPLAIRGQDQWSCIPLKMYNF